MNPRGFVHRLQFRRQAHHNVSVAKGSPFKWPNKMPTGGSCWRAKLFRIIVIQLGAPKIPLKQISSNAWRLITIYMG